MSGYPGIRRTAREEGLVAALELLHEDGVRHGPAGHALVVGRPAHLELQGVGLSVVRDPSAPSAPREWTLGLLWLRLGVSEWLLDRTMAYLGARTTGGTPLLLQQMVKGQLAEAVTEQVELSTLLAGRAPDRLDDPHRQITRADRALLRLLGGSGFRADGPGQAAHASELLADFYQEDRHDRAR
ncbi:acyl-CoA dehydrogenase family protein [Actinomadura harenae]|uniref:Acyl-CoA dehydrogenase n=1 Tax=Actinomadura harenae TaxID=2483351 RepID=A0A3M2LN46_9ACTN|nr:acyl-CoA dehydrogenase family protein [Actinomadura harenae]RMI38556.1 acyl-CoA dehydrogenase [Actinomadura harenae]